MSLTSNYYFMLLVAHTVDIRSGWKEANMSRSTHGGGGSGSLGRNGGVGHKRYDYLTFSFSGFLSRLRGDAGRALFQESA